MTSLGPSIPESPTPADVEAYFRDAADDDLMPETPTTLTPVAASHFALAARRQRGQKHIRVFAAAEARDGWSSRGKTVIQMVLDDRVFLLNSIVPFIAGQGLVIERMLHPVLWVARDGDLLRGVRSYDPQEPDRRTEELRESWIHIEVDAEYSPQLAAWLEQELAQVVEDVVHVTDDWKPMLARARSIIDSLEDVPDTIDRSDVSETRDFLRWLCDEHFTFIGYRRYIIADHENTSTMHALPETGLGILREGRLIAHAAQNAAAARAARLGRHPLLLITKADSITTVRRRVHLDRISIREFDSSGKAVGEHRFLGLFASAAYSESVRRIPILQNKSAAVLETLKYSPDSYNGKTVMSLLESFPRDELFSADVADVARILGELVYIRDRRKLRCFVRRDQLGRFLSVLVYLPRDRYATAARNAIEDVLSTLATGGVTMEHTAWVTEATLARLHVVVRPKEATTIDPVDGEELQDRLRQAIRTWPDVFADEVDKMESDPIRRGALIHAGEMLPEGYREDFDAATGLADVRRLLQVHPGHIALDFRPDEDDGLLRLTVYRAGGALSLAALIPIFTSFGIDLVDERPYELGDGGSEGWIYDFTMKPAAAVDADAREAFRQAFAACWSGEVEVDGYNRLVLSAVIPWRKVIILRAYAKFLRQTGNPFSEEFVQSALTRNSEVSRLLVELFETSFDPERGSDLAERRRARDEVGARLERALDEVVGRDSDGVLRSLKALIVATLRTNYYQRDADGRPKPWIALKFEPQQIDFLPAPRPRFEIFCYSPRVEGVHLRFGLIARGGLRWSERREDFRTEVLGLVKAQTVKNTVIVPTGSKGGFYAKRLPDPSDRDAWLAEGIEAYRVYIRALLDVTDNRVEGRTVPPADVVRWDADDSYLVVAADKGTSSFSDIANQIAEDYGFWLGDAFASGGSAGYDHKEMGITARGAWESVKRHFGERGVDCQKEDFTCVGIGDMSGDVFGNGMLLSRHTRLVAAFDHRHIFLDPSPSAATSYAERERLFHLKRSSWADYDASLISEGGGVFPRSAKHIDLTREIRAALDINADVERLSPPDLIKAVLRAPVDLLWNGGIGTYVKAKSESHADVGDKSNDAVRVDGEELRCAIAGEGGNLGFTQRGRVEFALKGGQINTDFIDNSAGVDTSDHEVNIKILLDSLVRDGTLSHSERDRALASMTDEVAGLVLDHNRSQNIALSAAIARSYDELWSNHELLRAYERRGRLDRSLEFLPSDDEISRRRSEDVGLTQPELSVLLAYTKIDVAEALKETTLADDPLFADMLVDYFPTPLREKYRDAIEQHPLRDDIIVTRVVNDVVDAAGLSYFHQIEAQTGAPPDMIARGHTVATRILGIDEIWRRLDDEQADIAIPTRTRVRLRLRGQIERASRWLITNTRGRSAPDVVAELFDPVQKLIVRLPQTLVGRSLAHYEEELERERNEGLPDDIAARSALCDTEPGVFGLAQLALRSGDDAADLARIHFLLGQRLGLDRLARQVAALKNDGRWMGMARTALADDVLRTHLGLTADVVASTSSGQTPEERAHAWLDEREKLIVEAHNLLRGMWTEGVFDVPKLTVSLQMAKRMLP